ncbi:MAG TPA: NADP-dependent isocitrate dehydrogenase, partial [Solibacterales bacterium]|nr:NADP-dependent isocitrate dehydrogenase [Bryobacterales bacterium]
IYCVHKANIMKMTDGLFHKVFEEIGADYPDIEKEHWIVDIGAAKLADTPGAFDVVVMPNLYGDILSDVAAQIAGSVGLAGSANIGVKYAMFEAIHGSAPRRAGQNLANPSGLLLAGVMMLVHIRQPEMAELVHNAWLRTVEEGIHTYDIFKDDVSKQKVGTKEFAQAVVARLGKKPEHLKPVSYKSAPEQTATEFVSKHKPSKKELIGVDVFVDWDKGTPNDLGQALEKLAGEGLRLVMLSNRGTKVYPGGHPDTITCDNWRCRFQAEEGKAATHAQIIGLLGRIAGAGYDFIKTEGLYTFDGQPGFTLGQGQ